MTVLTPLNEEELRNIFDESAIKIIDYMIKKSIFSQPEKMEWQHDLPIQMPKEHIEQWLAQALNARSIWAWSYPVDIISSDNTWGADIKMLSGRVDANWRLTNSDSWETSLWQNFRWAWNRLDQYFVAQEYETIKNMRLDLIREKLNIPVVEHWLSQIYYFILLRWGNYLYLLWMKVNLEELSNVLVNVNRTSADSVFLDNYIDLDLGNVKIYKAKKRMELRLHPKNWYDRWYMIPFEINLDNTEIAFRQYVEAWNDIMNYWKEKALRIFD